MSLWRAALLALAVGLAYSNSLSGPFILDDDVAIVGNRHIRELWDPAVLFPERELPTAGRPLVNVSLALNYAWNGLDVTSYHAVNISVHVVCTLLLFGLARRTFDMLGASQASVSSSANLALTIALLWALHPLNTETVDYLTQRTQSLMACFYLLTLYATARAAVAEQRRWHVVAVVACAAGMACKESMVTAPVAVVLYERAFVFDSFRDAFRRHRRFYVGLASTWLLLGALMWSGPRIHSAGFGTAVTPWTYLLNQSVVIADYLRLAVWPRALAVNYGWPQPLSLADVWPHVLFITALCAAVVVAVCRSWRVGVLGVWFFITLAPTSSIVPVATEVGAERRMYLPLIALLALAVVATSRIPRLHGRPAAVVVAVLALALAWGTYSRNRDYESPLRLAQTTLDRRPTSDAHHWLGVELIVAGRSDEAMPHLRQAVPNAPRAHYALGYELLKRGETSEAIHQLEQFLHKQPMVLEAISARSLLGRAYASLARWPEAIAQYRQVLTMNPSVDDRVTTHRFWGEALLAQGAATEAMARFNEAVRLRPNDVDALIGLGLGAVAADDLDRAAVVFERVLSIAPNNGAAHRNLAIVRFDQRNAEAAAPLALRAVQLIPEDPVAHDILGRVYAVQGRLADARREFERSLQIDPTYGQAREDLERMQATTGSR